MQRVKKETQFHPYISLMEAEVQRMCFCLRHRHTLRNNLKKQKIYKKNHNLYSFIKSLSPNGVYRALSLPILIYTDFWIAIEMFTQHGLCTVYIPLQCLLLGNNLQIAH